MRTFALTALGLAATTSILASCNSKGDQAAKTPPADPASVQSTSPASEPPLTIERSAQVRLTAKVKAVNYDTRVVTLEDASGHSTTFIAGSHVQRLNEVHVGDDVAADYTVSLVAELRPATAEEMANPISAMETTSRSPSGADPAVVASRSVRVVTTVQAVDLANMFVTLKGPMGDTTTVRARKPENVKKLHVGDTIVITYSHAVGVSLVKATP